MPFGRKPTGRHPEHRFTPVAIRAMTTPGRYADGNGLYLVVDDASRKRWIWRGVIQGKRCDLGLGSVRYVSLRQARDNARDYCYTARAGGDPRLEHRTVQRAVPTFKAAALAVHAEHSKSFKNAKHTAQWLASLENDVFPSIGPRPINTLASSDVLAVLTKVWTTKPETARRLKQRIKTVFEWAKASGHYDGENPVDGVTKVLPKHKNEEKQHHAALPYAHVPAFVQALRDDADTTATVRRALELLILTATRTSEVQQAQWREIDFMTQVWTIPAARMKSGRAHRIPLAPRAVELLQAAQADATGSPWIFPGVKPDKPLSNMTFLKAARRLTTATITTHGFRSSFRDWSAEKTNVPRDVCEMALAHTVRDKTEAAYKRTDLFERRRDLMDHWARFATTTPAAVVSIA